MNDSTLTHYIELINSIGAVQLTNLPHPYKKALQDTTKLENKIRILEFLIEHRIVRTK